MTKDTRNAEPYFTFTITRAMEGKYRVPFGNARELFGLGGTTDSELKELMRDLLSIDKRRGIIAGQIVGHWPHVISDYLIEGIDQVDSSDGNILY